MKIEGLHTHTHYIGNRQQQKCPSFIAYHDMTWYIIRRFVIVANNQPSTGDELTKLQAMWFFSYRFYFWL